MKTNTFTSVALALLLAAGTAQAVWIGATSGTTNDDAHNYTNVANWADGVIDDDFRNVTFTGETLLNFTCDHATGPGGLNTSYIGGQKFRLGSSPSSTIYTLALNGDLTHCPTAGGELSLGNRTYGQFNVDLGGAVRAFHCGTSILAASIVMGNTSSLTNGGILKTGKGGFTVGNVVHPYAGPTIVYDGSFSVNNGGAIRNSSKIGVHSRVGNAGLVCQTLVNGVNDRLGDQAPITLSSEGGSGIRAFLLESVSAAGASAMEDVGPLILRSGSVYVSHGYYSEIKGTTYVSAFLRTDSDALVRSNRTVCLFLNGNNGAETATFNNPSLGVWREAHGATNCGNRIVFATPPPTIGGTNSRGTDSPVVPFLMGKDTSVYYTYGADTLLTYDANGLRALRIVTNIVGQVHEFVTSLAAANADGYDNVYLRSGETIAVEKTINALVLGGTLTANARLTIRSGVLASLGGTTINGTVDVGGSEGVLQMTDTRGRGVTIGATLAGSNGYTFAPVNGAVYLQGANTYSGQTTIACGKLWAHRRNWAEPNVSFADDALLLVHPGAIVQLGHETQYVTQEVVGGLAGGGTVELGYISNPTESQRTALIIGAGGTGKPGEITLNGGFISPGLTDEVGTLSITTERNSALMPIPVTLTNGTFQVDIAGAGVCDVLSTMGAVNINAGGNLSIEVDVNRTKPSIGQQWTVLTSAIGPVSDGNGGKLVDAITDNSDRVNFTAAIALDGKSLVLTAIDANPGTVLIVR